MTENKRSLSLLSFFFLALGSANFSVNAQIIPDNTLRSEESRVTPINSQVDLIDGGAIRGANLFHSFREFNISEGRAAYFANPAAIQNIFSRVTGNNPSLLLGKLGVQGNANLFFINPNGIIFGKNASLDIRGSFVASTANSLLFPNGERFSATNPNAAPLLKINVPSVGWQFEGLEAKAIVNAGQLETEQNLALVGGTIVSTGQIEMPTGRVNLLTVPGKTVVRMDATGTKLTQVAQPQTVTERLTTHLAELVQKTGTNTGLMVNPDGKVQIDGSNVTVEPGDIVISLLSNDLAIASQGITIDANNQIKLQGIIDASALLSDDRNYLGNGGNIALIAKDNITLEPGSGIFSDGLLGGNITLASDADIVVNNGAIISQSFTLLPNLKSGNINIVASSLFLVNGTLIGTSNFGAGKGGDLNINTSGLVQLFGNAPNGFPSSLFALTQGEGNAGNLAVETRQLILSDNALIGNITQGKGRGGNLRIAASESLEMSGFSNLTTQSQSEGDAGNLTVNTRQLNIQGASEIATATSGKGKAGNLSITASESIELVGASKIASSNDLTTQNPGEGDVGNLTVNTRRLTVKEGSQIATNTYSQGEGGNLTVNASDLVELIGVAADDESSSGLLAATEGEGDAGDLKVNTRQLIIRDGARILTRSNSKGNGGNVTVNASESVELMGFSSGLFTSTRGEGDAGGLKVDTERLIIRDEAQIFTGTSSTGKGGNAMVNASESVELFGIGADDSFTGFLTSTDGEGNAGNLTIDTGRLLVRGGAQITTGTRNRGNGGILTISASESVELIGFTSALTTQTQRDGDAGNMTIDAKRLIVRGGALISTSTLSDGDAGNLTINAEQLLLNRAQISTTTFGKGKGGNLTVNASELVRLIGTDPNIFSSGLVTQTEGEGNAGNLTINTEQFGIQDGASVSASASGTGIGGNIKISANNLTLDKGAILTQTTSNNGGDIFLNLQNTLLIRNNSLISTRAGILQGAGDGGNITIDANFIVANPLENSDIIANAFTGRGGNINITAQEIFGLEVREQLTPLSDITASSQFGLDGNININALEIDPTRRLENLPEAFVTAEIRQGCQVNGGQANAEFYQIGRGGFPTSPNDWLTEDPFSYEGLIPLETPSNNSTSSNNIPQLDRKQRSVISKGLSLFCGQSVSGQ
ncbi:MAG: filamentous hemagglutinin N-terminal domain-containing protein [Hydrococcus sp. Prado102]|jgi:filamentous hemagglutinin family protein|nr:filamentous hemagglutinin N-terminal domain-containing protein [Hydrococcus sp. Prado102]